MKVPVVCYGKNKACGKVLGWIEMPTDGLSHGLCPECYQIEMRKADEYFTRQARAELATPAGPALAAGE